MRRTLIAVACVGLLIAGCSKKQEPGAGATTPPTCTDPATASGEAGKKPTIKVPNCQPPATLQKVDVIAGTGAEAKPGAKVTVHYVGVLWSNGQQFDASWDNNQPIEFELTGLIKGWQDGIPGMKVGGRRMLTIPPDLAYGPQGRPGIPPNSTLVFVIDLIKA